MMLPPIPRTGPPPMPYSTIRDYYVCLTKHGWVILTYSEQHGFYRVIYLEQGIGLIETFSTLDILCWMPQDGS